MPFTIVTAGELQFLTDVLNTRLDSCDVHLYKNDYTPVLATALGDLNESDFTGYAVVSAPTWSSPALDGANFAYIDTATLTFTPTADPAGQIAYGYYVTESGTLLFAQRFAGPVTLVDGVPLNFIIRFRFRNLP